MDENKRDLREVMAPTEWPVFAALAAFEEEPTRLGHLGQRIGSQSPKLRSWLIDAGSWLRQGFEKGNENAAVNQLTLDDYDNTELAQGVRVLQNEIIAAQERKEARDELLFWRLLVHFTAVGFRRLLEVSGH